jgi:hypothetical protein
MSALAVLCKNAPKLTAALISIHAGKGSAQSFVPLQRYRACGVIRLLVHETLFTCAVSECVSATFSWRSGRAGRSFVHAQGGLCAHSDNTCERR